MEAVAGRACGSFFQEVNKDDGFRAL